jgi:tetratricopeptide (TPR) repeat protein
MGQGPARFLAAAAHLANKGDRAGAEGLCRQILDVFPEEGEALHLLALLRRDADDPGEAADLLLRAAATRPDSPAVGFDLVAALVKADRKDEARDRLDGVADPPVEDHEARLRLAYLALEAGDRARAERLLRAAVAARPEDTGPALELVHLLASDGRAAESEALLRAWIDAAPAIVPPFELAMAAIDHIHRRWDEARGRLARVLAELPGDPKASMELARIHTHHGLYEEAVAVLQGAFDRHPDDRRLARHLTKALRRTADTRRMLTTVRDYALRHPDEEWAIIAMADSMVTLGDRTRFVAILDEVLKRDLSPEDRLSCALIFGRGRRRDRAATVLDTVPDDPDMPSPLLTVRGLALVEVGRIEEGTDCFRRLVARDPANVSAANHLATWLVAENRHALAIAVMEDSLAADPLNANIQQNLAMAHLQAGNLRAGFRLYPAVYRKDPYRAKFERYPGRLWDGAPLPAGERLLIWADQGIGDHIIYGNLFEATAARQPFAAEIEPRLIPLFARSFPWLEMLPRPKPDGDYGFAAPYAAHMPLCLLPGVMLGSRADLPPPRAYLKPDPDRVRELRTQLRSRFGDRPLVGLSWRSVNSHIGHYKTTSLLDWAPVLRTPGVVFVALQYGDVAEEIRTAAATLGVTVHEAAGVDRFHDLEGLAALVAALDAVVTTSNTNAHVAGAVGTPTATVLSADPGLLWYWFRDVDVSPWYPRMDLVRQPVPGAWEPAFERAAAWLAARTGTG